MTVMDDSFEPPPLPLQTARLTLRLHRPQDETRLQEIYSQPEVARFLLEEPWSRQDAAKKTQDRLERTDLLGTHGSLALAFDHCRLHRVVAPLASDR